MSDPERDLREALRSRAAAVPVGWADEAGLGRRLVAAQRRRRAKVGAAALALLIVAGSASVLAREDAQGPNVIAGPDQSSTTTVLEPTTTTTTTEATVAPIEPIPAPTTTQAVPALPGPATTSAPAAARPTTTTTAPLPAVPDDAFWPPPGSKTVFGSPDKAADDFARRFLGMAGPQVIPGRVSAGGDEATVDLRPFPSGGPTTTVLLRRAGARGWVVVGCSAERIFVEQPSPGAPVTSPLTVRGRAQAYEGTVDVEVRRDGATTPIGRSFGTGGGTEVLPFEATVEFARPSTARGTVVVSEGRADDDSKGPAAATVVRIRF